MLIEKNIEILSDGKPHWIAEHIDNEYPKFLYKDENKEYFEVKENKIIAVESNLDETFVYSKYKREIIFAFGILGVEELSELKKSVHKDSVIIVIEPQLNLLTHTLHNKSFKIFRKSGILLFADHITDNLNEFIQSIIYSFEALGMARNIRFYFTDYYRKTDFSITKQYISKINQVLTSILRTTGNDVDDSLQGLNQNLSNLEYIVKSKNPAFLKNRFRNKPAVVIAAGPSLNKNIEILKANKEKLIIVAVDTIVSRLVKEGIIPDFICTVERVVTVYDYFYKDKDMPKEITLVAPPLLHGEIFKEFKGNLVLPFRTEVNEYRWLKEILNVEEDASTLVGISCAHMAFGFAHHLGCSPIILIGQDLAYGESERETHASGTTYDNLENNKIEETFEVPGYNGGTVKSTAIWNMFRVWYESKIAEYEIDVINATEGGSKIANTRQMTLKEAINKYGTSNIENVYSVINDTPIYNIDLSIAKRNLSTMLDYIEAFRRKCLIYFNNVSNINIDSENIRGKQLEVVYELNKIKYLNEEISTHKLLSHNLQSQLIKYLWNYNDIDEIWNLENLKRYRDINIRYLGAVIVTLTRIEEIINNNLKNDFLKD
ncbi:6-hydroxymethylpterin diphosphokinase MptE-like protein [Solibacillus sp. FSL H8-0523]|uniref:motility associated factor glycosyltransferase family protein n=1 Tax=Solibacillus sp. FSL H8-0523 TaxID=2954511 RepID=UPI003100DCB3